MLRKKIYLTAFSSVLVYFFSLFLCLWGAVSGRSKNQAYDTFSDFFILFLLCLFGFPLLQFFVANLLISKGKVQCAKGIKNSIAIEIVLLFFVFLILAIWLAS